MKKVLIITFSKDNESVSKVEARIKESGGLPIRLNVDEYPLKYSLTSLYENDEWKTYLVYDSGQKIDLSDLEAIWFRRGHHIGACLTGVLDSEFLDSTMKEVQRTLYGFIEGADCFKMGTYSQYRRLDSKEEQLKIASSLGLKIPRTCITNSPVEAKKFVRSIPEGVISKMQAAFAIYRDNIENVVFTNIVKESDLEDIDDLSYCPMQFQEKIDKEVELRITIIGDKVFTMALDSKKVPNAKIDWRREGVLLLNKWESYKLPSEIEEKLLSLMKIYGLNYGAIDIMVDPKGDYYFLEVNPAGEFYWLDNLLEGQLTDQISEVLLGNVSRI